MSSELRTVFPFLLLAFAAAGCDKKNAAAGAVASTTPRASAAPVELPPLTGPLTSERILASKDAVKPFDDWDKAYPKLERTLGKPTKVDGDRSMWAVVEGDACTFTYVSKDDRSKYFAGQSGSMIGAYMAPSKGDKKSGNDDCFEAAGKPLFPDDPKALPPAATPMALAVVLDNATKAPSKWDKQPIKVNAYLGAVSSYQDGTKERVTVHLVLAAGKATPDLVCNLVEGAKKPDDPGSKSVAVLAQGTIHVAKFMNGSGERSLGVDLQDCTITPAKR